MIQKFLRGDRTLLFRSYLFLAAGLLLTATVLDMALTAAGISILLYTGIALFVI